MYIYAKYIPGVLQAFPVQCVPFLAAFKQAFTPRTVLGGVIYVTGL